MSQEQQSCLRFSLEESIWFKRGQEVEELLSISLDPHITIQEQEQYVLIRGTLDLTGEYLPSSAEEFDREEDWINNSIHGKFVQTVEKREKGECEFVHSFPVDVTIPKNRIANLSEIDVYVEAFDYLMPENACLRLNADLTISGIYGEQQANHAIELVEDAVLEPLHRSAPVLEDTEEVDQETLTETEEDQESTYFHIEEQEEEEIGRYTEEYGLEEEGDEKEEVDEFIPFSVEGRKQVDEELVRQVEEEEEEAVPVQIHYDSYGAEPNEEPDQRKEKVFDMPEPELSESSEQTESYKEPIKAQHDSELQHAPKSAYEEESSSSSAELEIDESVDEKKGKIFKKKYETISLTDFFARKEEERAAKLKVCIVQEGETLDYIAEKYELTVPQILRVNNLEANQDVYEGQVLYIPDEPVFKT